MPIENIVKQNPEKIPTVKERLVGKDSVWDKFKIKQKKAFYLTGALMIMLVSLTILFNTIIKQPARPKSEAIPTPTPTATMSPILPQSPYATDSAILEIETEVKNTESDLITTDLKESNLNPPLLDMDVRL